LPVFLGVYFLVPAASVNARNAVLLAGSLVFYAWGEPSFILLFAAQCVSAWAFGFAIDKFRGKQAGRVFFILSCAVSLSGLLIFKYADFFIANINRLPGADFSLLELTLPIGVSFYTFQILSYTIDLDRGNITLQRSPVDFSAYVAMFPQLIAGPIVRYADVARELSGREHTLARFASGGTRFTLGLAKKVLLANTFGGLVTAYKDAGENSVLFGWLYVVAFAMQIYFDFSGYSDMAIGMGRILGFNFLENFDYPYTAKSITEFWRRWHMSLSGWFRDYVYIPMGGSRVKPARHLFNILLCWLLTGFWHGADWNFICWGLYFGLLLLFEKYALSKFKLPAVIGHVYLLLAVGIGWVFFDGSGFAGIGATLGSLIGVGADGLYGTASVYYLRSYAVPLIIGVLGCTRLPKLAALKLNGRTADVLEMIMMAAMLLLVTAFLADGSFNPFIYFRF
jgi:alginate O-acetyltransferase complex protein AlgI